MNSVIFSRNKRIIFWLAFFLVIFMLCFVGCGENTPLPQEAPPDQEKPLVNNTYTVDFPVLEGLIFISTGNSVLEGENFSFTVEDNYMPTAPFTLSANGEVLAATEGVYTLNNVKEDIVITYSGVYNNEIALSADIDSDLVIVEFSATAIKYGGSASFTVTLAEKVNRSGITVKANGQPIMAGANGAYLLSGITEAQVISVENITTNSYSVNYMAQGEGSLEGEKAQKVKHGESGTEVRAVPNAHNVFVKWSDGNTSATRTDVVLTDINIYAVFEREKVAVGYSDIRFTLISVT